jgi:hypothetical protein
MPTVQQRTDCYSQEWLETRLHLVPCCQLMAASVRVFATGSNDCFCLRMEEYLPLWTLLQLWEVLMIWCW